MEIPFSGYGNHSSVFYRLGPVVYPTRCLGVQPYLHSRFFLINLPLEEWLFFFIVPFASVFIYEVLIYFFPKDPFKPVGKVFIGILVPLLLVLSILHLDKWYTSVNFLVGALALTIHYLLFKEKYLGRFIFAYLVHLIPLMICNGILTGGLTEEPVVIYNNSENLGIRIWTVPIEDLIYSMTLLLMNISFLEYFRKTQTISPNRG